MAINKPAAANATSATPSFRWRSALRSSAPPADHEDPFLLAFLACTQLDNATTQQSTVVGGLVGIFKSGGRNSSGECSAADFAARDGTASTSEARAPSKPSLFRFRLPSMSSRMKRPGAPAFDILGCASAGLVDERVIHPARLSACKRRS